MVLRPKLLTVTSEVTASRETLATRRTRECLWRAILVGRTATSMLCLLIRHLLLSVCVVLGIRDVTIVVEHLHGRLLHRGGRGIAHAVHVLSWDRGVGRERLLRLL